MKEEEFNEELIKKFPTILREALQDEKSKKRFINTVSVSFPEVTVFRAIHKSDCIDNEDFECDVIESRKYNRKLRKPYNIACYSISVNEDIEQLKLAVKFPNHNRPLEGIAKGTMRCEYGPADNILEKTHHNWYLFEKEINNMKGRFVLVKGG